MGENSLPKTVTRQRRDCDLNPGPSAPESSTLTTRLPSHPLEPEQVENGNRPKWELANPTSHKKAVKTRKKVTELKYMDHFCLHGSCLQCFDAVGWVAGRASGL